MHVKPPRLVGLGERQAMLLGLACCQAQRTCGGGVWG